MTKSVPAGRVMDVAVGDGLLGRVIDPLGKPLDDKGPIDARERIAGRPSGTADHGPGIRGRST